MEPTPYPSMYPTEDTVDPSHYLVPAIVSLASTVLAGFLISTGVLHTFLNKYLVFERYLYLFLSSLYITTLSRQLESNHSNVVDSCVWLGPLLLFLILASTVSFGVLMIDIYEVFREPFRTQKYQVYRYTLPTVVATLFTFVLVCAQKSTFRNDLGVCWVPKEDGGWRSFNTINWIVLYTPAFIAFFIAGLVALYCLYNMKFWQPLFFQTWHIRQFLGPHVLVLIELILYVLGVFTYWAVVLYFYLLTIQERDSNFGFIFAFASQGSVEAGILVVSNVLRCFFTQSCAPQITTENSTYNSTYRMSRIRTRSSATSLSKASFTSDDYQQLVSSEEEDDSTLSFELYVRKKLLKTLENFLCSGERQLLFNESVTVTSIAPQIFERIRTQAGIIEFHSSFKGIASKVKVEAGGASGAIFAITTDQKYRLKGLDQTEGEAMERLIADLGQEWLRRPNSLICRVYGLYSVELMGTQIWFQVMQDVFSALEGKPDEIYDMKGSEYKREVGTNPIDGDVLKDLDFRLPVLLSDRMQKLVLDNLEQDCHFLASRGFMDYSILVGIRYTRERVGEDLNIEDVNDVHLLRRMPPHSIRRTQHYAFGLIDYLQEWNFQKQGENYLKRFFKCVPNDQVSAIPPPDYCERFVKNISKRLFKGGKKREKHQGAIATTIRSVTKPFDALTNL